MSWIAESIIFRLSFAFYCQMQIYSVLTSYQPWNKSSIARSISIYTTGFFYNKPTHETQIYDSNTYVNNYTYLGLIQFDGGDGTYGFVQKNKFECGDEIEIMKPDGQVKKVIVKRMLDEDGQEIENCPHPGMKVFIDVGIKLDEYDIMRIEK